MKIKLAFALLLIFFKAINCQAQFAEKIPVPILRESSTIDKLMDIISKEEKSSDGSNAALTDTCWRIEVRSIESYISFQVVKNQTPYVNVLVNRLKSYNDKHGYFNYKGHKVFVWVDKDFNKFFNKTGESQTFNFIYKLDDNSPVPTISGKIYHFKYVNGSFSIEGPPPMRSN